MSNFLYDNERVSVTQRSKETGNTQTVTEYVPRNLPALDDPAFDDQAFAAAAFGFQMGAKTRVSAKGTQIRDIFLVKVQGDMSDNGRRYPYKKIGTAFSGVTQDTETNEMKRWHSYQHFGEEQQTNATAADVKEPGVSAATKADEEAAAKAEANEAVQGV